MWLIKNSTEVFSAIVIEKLIYARQSPTVTSSHISQKPNPFPECQQSESLIKDLTSTRTYCIAQGTPLNIL